MAGSRLTLSLGSCRRTALVAGMSGMLCSIGAARASAQVRVADNRAKSIESKAQVVTIDVDRGLLPDVLHRIAQQAGLTAVYDGSIVPESRRVTLHLRQVNAAEAFSQALEGTGLVARVRSSGDVLIVRGRTVVAGSGVIAGTVVDSATGTPVKGATVGLDGHDRGAVTDAKGEFRMAGVLIGDHRVTVRMLGYVRKVHTVSVAENQTITLAVALVRSVNALDQVVVTGTVTATELKAVPNAITVITAKQIEDRGITRIEQLFRGDVPGLFATNSGTMNSLGSVTMYSRGATAMGQTYMDNTNAIKTYVDGVELADPSYLSQIDPRSIERIEILTGPQASTIYGSNALNGVMQIFTKRGSSAQPQLMLSLLSGLVQNNFSSARTPQHDYSAQVSGLDGRISYNGGITWRYIGPWSPSQQHTDLGAFGGARISIPTKAGVATADFTYRQGATQSISKFDSYQAEANLGLTGVWSTFGNPYVSKPGTSSLSSQTVGLTLTYAPIAWWSNELTLGRDRRDLNYLTWGTGYSDPSDTSAFSQTLDHNDRRSVRFATTAKMPVSSWGQGVVTLGADEWQDLEMAQYSPYATSTLRNVAMTTYTTPGHNAGAFVQAQLGVMDRLFVTYGLRGEWNPNFGENIQPNMAPRYGIALTQDVGSLTTKLRASYGRSTRPPRPSDRAGYKASTLYGSGSSTVINYGDFDLIKANRDLLPEHQKGVEAGLELYWGSRASLIVTRYNQTVDGLIARPFVDSVRSLVTNPVEERGISCAQGLIWWGPNFVCHSMDDQGYGYLLQSQNLNIGSIRNQGWELQSSVTNGPLTTRGTLSWTKSRSLGVIAKYKDLFPPLSYPQMQKGAAFNYLPEHTWSFGMTYARGGSSISLNLTGLGPLHTLVNDEFMDRNLIQWLRLDDSKYRVTPINTYLPANSGYTMADLMATHRFARQVEGVFQMTNLANQYKTDIDWGRATMGRQTQVGLRIRF